MAGQTETRTRLAREMGGQRGKKAETLRKGRENLVRATAYDVNIFADALQA